MSSITEIKLKINLRKDTPTEVINLINDCLSLKTIVKPSHKFFQTQRWYNMFSTMCYDGYEQSHMTESEKSYELKIHTDINYENTEIETFCEWIEPYVIKKQNKVCIGTKISVYDFMETDIYV